MRTKFHVFVDNAGTISGETSMTTNQGGNPQLDAAPADVFFTPVDLRIYAAVINAVMANRLRPGTHLGEADFCDLYQTSRTTVRKALQQLAHDGVIELRPNRGAVIASPTIAEAQDIIAARRALEREIVALVIQRANRASLKQLRQALDAEDRAKRSGDHASWIRLSGQFHLRLAEIAGNQVLLHFMTGLVARCSLIVALYEPAGAPICESDEHAALVTLIEQGKTEEAMALIGHHLCDIESHLRLVPHDKKVNLADALAAR
jgi:DNA-binding GntR family transcriptional regulator